MSLSSRIIQSQFHVWIALAFLFYSPGSYGQTNRSVYTNSGKFLFTNDDVGQFFELLAIGGGGGGSAPTSGMYIAKPGAGGGAGAKVTLSFKVPRAGTLSWYIGNGGPGGATHSVNEKPYARPQDGTRGGNTYVLFDDELLFLAPGGGGAVYADATITNQRVISPQSVHKGGFGGLPDAPRGQNSSDSIATGPSGPEIVGKPGGHWEAPFEPFGAGGGGGGVVPLDGQLGAILGQKPGGSGNPGLFAISKLSEQSVGTAAFCPQCIKYNSDPKVEYAFLKWFAVPLLTICREKTIIDPDSCNIVQSIHSNRNIEEVRTLSLQLIASLRAKTIEKELMNEIFKTLTPVPTTYWELFLLTIRSDKTGEDKVDFLEELKKSRPEITKGRTNQQINEEYGAYVAARLWLQQKPASEQLIAAVETLKQAELAMVTELKLREEAEIYSKELNKMLDGRLEGSEGSPNGSDGSGGGGRSLSGGNTNSGADQCGFSSEMHGSIEVTTLRCRQPE